MTAPYVKALVMGGLGLVVLAALATPLVVTAVRQGPSREEEARQLTGGDPRQGERLMQHYGCGTCHQIPGVPGARGTVGPALAGLGQRSYLAGKLDNTPENLVRWVVDPQQVVPGNAMPDMNVSDEEARHIAAYLYAH
jgi:cytochrome c